MMLVIKLGQQMEQRQAKEIGAGKGVEKFDVRRAIEAKGEEANGAQHDAGEEEEIIQNQVVHSCKPFAITAP
jgi:hypothetical protein